MSRFGNGSNSNGQFWYGSSVNFPGFLYKKNVGVGARRSTKFAPGGNTTCNENTYIYNKYKPGTGGVGASSIATRRAKNRLATVCEGNKCFPCYNTLGQYSNYTHNPNGFIPCPYYISCNILFNSNAIANMNTTGMTKLTYTNGGLENNNIGYAYLPFTGLDFYFFGINYGNSDGSNPSKSIYINPSNALGFGNGITDNKNWNVNNRAILFDFFNSQNYSTYVSSVLNGPISGAKYLRIVSTGTDFYSFDSGDNSIKKTFEIYCIKGNCYQYVQFNCDIETVDRTQYPNYLENEGNGSNITNGTNFLNTFGSFYDINSFSRIGPQSKNSYVIRSDLNGYDWKFFPNTRVIL